MNWHDLIDIQMDLHRFWGTDTGYRYGKSMGGSFVTKNDLDDKSESHLFTEKMADLQRYMLFYAEPIFVSSDIGEIHAKALETFKPEPLLMSDLLVMHGFAYFERPFYIPDSNGKAMSNRAISWGPIMDASRTNMGILLSFYTHEDDEDDYQKAGEIKFPGTKLSLNHIERWWFGFEIPADASEDRLSTYYQTEGYDGETVFRAHQITLSSFQVLMRLASQRITTTDKSFPPKSFKKRAERADFTPYVTVITLRRPKKRPEGEPSTVDWKHRWIVGGHWRNQWYPSINMHRQIWISDFVKGPDDKELVIRKERVFNFIR